MTTITIEVDGLELACRRCGRTEHKIPTDIRSAWTVALNEPGKDPDRLVVSQWQDPKGWEHIAIQRAGEHDMVCPECALVVRKAIADALGPPRNAP